MNNDRRKRLEKIRNALDLIAIDLEAIGEEEQDTFDNLPMSLAESERGESMQESIDALNNAFDNLNEAINEILRAKGEL